MNLLFSSTGVGTTLDTYSHVMPCLQEQVAGKFDNIFEPDEEENLELNQEQSVIKK